MNRLTKSLHREIQCFQIEIVTHGSNHVQLTYRQIKPRTDTIDDSKNSIWTGVLDQETFLYSEKWVQSVGFLLIDWVRDKVQAI